MQGAVGAQGFPAALEQGGIAAFQAQGRNLHQGIGAAFKNNADHANGAGNAVQVQARGQLPAQGGAADGVRQRAQRPQALHHVPALSQGAEEQNGCVILLLQLPAQLHAVAVGQHDVQHHQIHRMAFLRIIHGLRFRAPIIRKKTTDCNAMEDVL